MEDVQEVDDGMLPIEVDNTTADKHSAVTADLLQASMVW